MMVRALITCGLLLALASVASAAIVPTIGIVVGSHQLDPSNPATWQVPIYVTGGTAVQGCNFNAQVGDGGPASGGTLGPVITAVDLQNGIFVGNNNGQVNQGSVPQLAMYTITTANGTVSANGLLVTLTIDPTGFTSGTWDLKLGNTLNGSTDFAPAPASITNGSITVIPEPASMSLLALGGLALLRRRSAQKA